MAHPMDESKNGSLHVDLDRRLKLEFHGSKVTSDGGLLAYRELDDALSLTEPAANLLEDGRRGRNGWHAVVGMLRQSVFGRAAGRVRGCQRRRAAVPQSGDALAGQRQGGAPGCGVIQPDGPLRDPMADG